MIQVDDLQLRIGNRTILNKLHFEVQRGEIFGVIGPNGSGKSTLLKLLSGLEKPTRGTVYLDGRPVNSYSRKKLATWLAVLQQSSLPSIGFTVKEVVEMGRYPYQNWMGEEAEDVRPLISSILDKLRLEKLQDRMLSEISGGEKQRAALGKVMAQEPRLLMLDEPTTYLDIGTQVELMTWIQAWKKESDLTVVVVLHDLNLAAQYCDRILLLHQGEVVEVGTAEQVMKEDLLQRVYGVKPYVLKHPVLGVPQILL
ncbi:heme ABC transporter ATP-binding protein [Marinicrinis lubricantis]|uniref:Heme ABC transporter ATP-binding protein n=1 Tax=Marinicrinis lubricantis TaxID=2086470 RepID=A0ABW1IQW6_9BACL